MGEQERQLHIAEINRLQARCDRAARIIAAQDLIIAELKERLDGAETRERELRASVAVLRNAIDNS